MTNDERRMLYVPAKLLACILFVYISSRTVRDPWLSHCAGVVALFFLGDSLWDVGVLMFAKKQGDKYIL